VRVIGAIVALAAALALQTTLAGLTVGGATYVNLALVAVIYLALAFGPVAGLFAGTAGGLVQDALAGGVIGVGGFSKTLVGFVVGVLGAQFIVSQPLPRFVMFVAATVVHELCFQSLYALVEAHGLRIVWPTLLVQACVNALIGVVAFSIVEQMPGVVARRNARRGASLSRRRF
jgi:rod shape-determining protein MreD